jgi:hypothetical protein
MKIIAHRGNIYGPNPTLENHPSYLQYAFKNGFEVEVDVWYCNSEYALGHDEPTYPVDLNFLKSLPGWFHAKNLLAMEQMHRDGLHYFWHQSDNFTLTSKGIPWCFPGYVNSFGISVLDDKSRINIRSLDCLGVCTDYAFFYKGELNGR